MRVFYASKWNNKDLSITLRSFTQTNLSNSIIKTNNNLLSRSSLHQYWFTFSYSSVVTFRTLRIGVVRRATRGDCCYNLLWTGGGIVAGWWKGWYWRARMSPYNPNSTLYIHYICKAVSTLGMLVSYGLKRATKYLPLVVVVDSALALCFSLVSLVGAPLCEHHTR